MSLFGDIDWQSTLGIIGGGITLVGMACLGLYFAWKKGNATINEAGDKAQRVSRKEDMGIDSEALYKLVEFLTKANDVLRETFIKTEQTSTAKIISANDATHEAEKEAVIWKLKFETAEARAKLASARADSAECELEHRLKPKEGQA